MFGQITSLRTVLKWTNDMVSSVVKLAKERKNQTQFQPFSRSLVLFKKRAASERRLASKCRKRVKLHFFLQISLMFEIVLFSLYKRLRRGHVCLNWFLKPAFSLSCMIIHRRLTVYFRLLSQKWRGRRQRRWLKCPKDQMTIAGL